jgi:hypothetical protein
MIQMLTPRHLSQKNNHICPKADIYQDAYYSFTCNGPKPKTTRCPSTGEWTRRPCTLTREHLCSEGVKYPHMWTHLREARISASRRCNLVIYTGTASCHKGSRPGPGGHGAHRHSIVFTNVTCRLVHVKIYQNTHAAHMHSLQHTQQR